MAGGHEAYRDEVDLKPMSANSRNADTSRQSIDSISSVSSRSVILENINGSATTDSNGHADFGPTVPLMMNGEKGYDREETGYNMRVQQAISRKTRVALWTLSGICLGGWLLALFLFLSQGTYKHPSTMPHDPVATEVRGSGKQITIDQIQGGQWYAKSHAISWINGANGEDGLLMEAARGPGKDYLVVEDVRSRKPGVTALATQTLMKTAYFVVDGRGIYPSGVTPSPDLKKVLVLSDKKKNWRHSYTGRYWIFDVATQSAEPLDPHLPDGRVQLATWAPTSDSIVFTRDNNLFIRKLSSDIVIQITKDGGPEFFYGIPDWVYEEEVFQTNTATWWSQGGDYVAFLSTNETVVPDYPLQYFLSRPSGTRPLPGEENYPELREIKYPKAGAPNPTVDLFFYDVAKNSYFKVDVENDFKEKDRLITEVVWAGKDGNVLVRATNRESDVLKVILINARTKSGKTVREVKVAEIDGGWFEVSEYTKFIPSDPANGRPHDGYIDTVITDGYDHLAYFTPLDNPKPIQLTSGNWEVVKAPSAIDLKRNLVYFVATKESSIQRHVYSVNLDGSNLQPMTETSNEGYYDVSFSTGAGYALLSYKGPGIPSQRVISTPSNDDHFENIIEENKQLAAAASKYELPILIYSTVTIDGFEFNVVERRPRHFDDSKKYPVLFYQYQGPASQTVDKVFKVDFQSYLAATLGYIVVTVDGRGTGFIGRKARCAIRGNIGYWESHDQIETAKIWAAKKYVDEERLAIWGWSYGGFMTLKTLEQDGGRTFKYGMAVAPVTDWRFYDSIYTERYMHTPQHNPSGYENATISNMTALASNVRFLIMHGVADDNVHFQNSLTLIDKLDLAQVENYDFHAFPDSDHSIFFHNANRMVYDRLNYWLINAFNGEWLQTGDAKPLITKDVSLSVR